MKRKRTWLWCVIIVVILIAIAGLAGWKMGLFEKIFVKRYEAEREMEMTAAVQGKELMALASSEEEAEEIAFLYNIELVSYADGVAVYTTEEPVRDVILRGKEEGYPELSINFIREAY